MIVLLLMALLLALGYIQLGYSLLARSEQKKALDRINTNEMKNHSHTRTKVTHYKAFHLDRHCPETDLETMLNQALSDRYSLAHILPKTDGTYCLIFLQQETL